MKDFKQHPFLLDLNPIVLVLHVDESDEEHIKMFEFLKNELFLKEGWTECASKEEANKHIDRLFKNKIPFYRK